MPKKKPGAKMGRPKSTLPKEVLDSIGPIPIGNPLAQARWWTNAIGVLTLGVLEGQPWKEMLETVRASAGAAGRVLPHDIIFEAARIVDASEREMKNTGAVTPTKRSDVTVGRTGAVRRDPH